MANQRQKEDTTWSSIVFRIGINAVSHPVEYAKILIQIGYEPIPPRPTKTLFGRPALALPNIFQYLSHIKSVDGFCGCYRGLGPKLCANAVSGITFQKVTDSIHFEGEDEKSKDDDEITEEERRRRFLRSLLKGMSGRIAAILTSHPFHVMAVRMMAQFVGGETRYTGVFASIREIYRDNGISGFFSGVMPRIVGDTIALIVGSTLTFVVNSYFIEDRDLRTYTSASLSFIASAITYPFQVVTNTMAVTNSGLAAGSPPHMPIYVSWTDCWSHLSRTNQLKRGSSLLWRYYTGPQVVIHGQAVMVDSKQFQDSTFYKYN